ncbi:MAG: hypothetical protein AAFP19_15180, partial [Bacteroidota bacterium]
MKKTFYAFFCTLALLLVATGVFAQGTLSVGSGAAMGDYFYLQATFGPAVSTISGELIFANDDNGTTTGCDPLNIDATNKIALIDRGACAFAGKAI